MRRRKPSQSELDAMEDAATRDSWQRNVDPWELVAPLIPPLDEEIEILRRLAVPGVWLYRVERGRYAEEFLSHADGRKLMEPDEVWHGMTVSVVFVPRPEQV